MPFTILPINYDVDIPRIAAIEIASYAASDKSLDDILFPPSPSTATESDQDAIKSTISRLCSDKHELAVKFVKLIDTDLVGNSEQTGSEAIIAFARWKFFTSDKLVEIKYLKTSDLPDHFGPGCNAEAVMDYFGSVCEAKERLYGEVEHAYLAGLCCDPLHQGRGAGSLLVKWGCEMADSLGLKTYLEASLSGLRLYRKFGFKEIEQVYFDPSKYGGEESNHVTVVMVRPAVVYSSTYSKG